jgi:hypothetical protein
MDPFVRDETEEFTAPHPFPRFFLRGGTSSGRYGAVKPDDCSKMAGDLRKLIGKFGRVFSHYQHQASRSQTRSSIRKSR